MSKKILLIESDAAMARTLSSALEARGFEARVTGDGKEGLDLARVDRPDLIVLCVELPKMSGYAVCNKLKKDDELKGIPLVITSAEATPETFESHKKLKARAEEYLIKPFDGAVLLETIATLIEMPPAPETAEEIVTLDDVEEIEPLEVEPAPEPEIVEPVDVMADGTGAAARGESYDDDLRLLDEAFENIAGQGDEPSGGFQGPAEHGGTPFGDSAGSPLSDIDRLEAEADAALAALQAEPTDEQFAAAAVALAEVEPEAMEPPVQQVVQPLPHDDGADAASILEAKGRAAQLTLELERAREAIQLRDTELADLRPRARALTTDLEAQTARTRRLEEQAQRANEEVARMTEAAKRDEESLRATHDEIRAAEERLKEAEALAASEQDRADRAEKERQSLETALGAATERAEAAEREVAQLRQKLEEEGQTSTRRGTEAEQARESAEKLAQDVESLRTRLATQEGEIAALQPQLDAARQALSDLHSQGDAAAADAQRKLAALEATIADLEAQNAKHEERILKAYQKIKGDEKMREKTRKALAIALQLLEDRPASVAVGDDQPRRE